MKSIVKLQKRQLQGSKLIWWICFISSINKMLNCPTRIVLWNNIYSIFFPKTIINFEFLQILDESKESERAEETRTVHKNRCSRKEEEEEEEVEEEVEEEEEYKEEQDV